MDFYINALKGDKYTYRNIKKQYVLVYVPGWPYIFISQLFAGLTFYLHTILAQKEKIRDHVSDKIRKFQQAMFLFIRIFKYGCNFSVITPARFVYVSLMQNTSTVDECS